MAARYKIPQSVLVLIHRPPGEVLLMRRSDPAPDGSPFWQSVTGSKDRLRESWRATAAREVFEETGIDCRAGSPLAPALHDWRLENRYEIYPHWRHRYAPGVWENTERIFALALPADWPDQAVSLSPREHTEYVWLPWRAAAARCYSASNAEAILLLPRGAGTRWSREEPP